MTEEIVEVQRIECLGAAFNGRRGEFRIGWMIDLGWTRVSTQLTVSQADVELGEDWLVERFCRSILERVAGVRAFLPNGREAVA
ncbi:MAG: hypothetical protein H7A35_05820 [Planctomycetales bacterium]|nr:hypothetical protein [bacterium]UNM09577.1 MAG: hypothetical protein H7A35_05820 [Planctomycetales bacterium]